MVIRIGTIGAILILGFLLGAATLNLILGFHLDNAELEIQSLHAKLADQSEQIKVLEDSLAKRQKTTVSKIDIHIISKDDEQDNEYDNLEMEKKIKHLLQNVRGQEVAALDPLLIANIIDNRVIEILNRQFLLEVKGTLVSETLIMYIEVKKSPLSLR